MRRVMACGISGLRGRSAPRVGLAWGVALVCVLASVPRPGVAVAAADEGAVGPPVIRAGGEELQGAWVGDQRQVAVFRGIPFAAPPTGELRWRAPAPHSPRAGRQAAIEFAPACMQGSDGIDWYTDVARAFGHGPEVVGRPVGVSEDCLYLNLWSPRTAAATRLPVMVFVHGGGNAAGWSYEPNYLGARLASHGVVVVTIAYRLGPFGFFAHPALEDGDEPVANFGLLDIRAAFDWLLANIAAFGGDPARITAFGESAGALNLVDLLLADLARGDGRTSPFRRLISQSIGGSLVGRQDLEAEQAVGRLLAGFMGLDPDATAADLRAVPAKAVLAAATRLPEGHYPDGVVDGRTLPGQPLELMQTASADGVELLIGTNADEWLMYIDEAAEAAELESWLAESAPGRQAEVLAEVAEEKDLRRKLDRLHTAQEMLCPSRFLAEWVNERGGQAWVYYFTRQRNGVGGERLGSYHGAELPYVFDTHDAWLPTAEADRVLTDGIVARWLAFAAKGDPSPAGAPQWPRHARGDAAVMELGDRIGLMAPSAGGLCRLLGPRASLSGGS